VVGPRARSLSAFGVFVPAFGITGAAGFGGPVVVVWGLQLPTVHEVALLGIPFFALAWIAGRLAHNTKATRPA
jgi:hypothetical protein